MQHLQLRNGAVPWRKPIVAPHPRIDARNQAHQLLWEGAYMAEIVIVTETYFPASTVTVCGAAAGAKDSLSV